MLDDLRNYPFVTRIVDDSWVVLKLGHQVGSEVCPWHIPGIHFGFGEVWVQRVELFDHRRELALLQDEDIVALIRPKSDRLPRQTLPGCFLIVRLSHLELEPSGVAASDDLQHLPVHDVLHLRAEDLPECSPVH